MDNYQPNYNKRIQKILGQLQPEKEFALEFNETASSELSDNDVVIVRCVAISLEYIDNTVLAEPPLVRPRRDPSRILTGPTCWPA